MYVTPEQIQAANKANVDAILALATSQYAAFEKFANLNATALKTAFEDSMANARALAGAKDAQELISLQTSFAQPAIEKAVAYSKSVYEVATQTNAELSKLAEKRVAEWNENFVSLLDKAAKNAPAGSDVAVTAMKQMIAAANSAYDNMTKVAKQATEIAEANVTAATETAKNFAKPPGPGAARAAPARPDARKRSRSTGRRAARPGRRYCFARKRNDGNEPSPALRGAFSFRPPAPAARRRRRRLRPRRFRTRFRLPRAAVRRRAAHRPPRAPRPSRCRS
jgi:phasin family protein